MAASFGVIVSCCVALDVGDSLLGVLLMFMFSCFFDGRPLRLIGYMVLDAEPLYRVRSRT